MSGRIGYLLRLAVSLGLLAILATQIDLTQSLQVIARVNPWAIVFTWLASQSIIAVVTYRWKLLLKCNNVKVEFTQLARLMYITGFFGMFLPGAVSVDAMRIAGLARSTSDLASSFSSVLVDRLFGVIALALLMLLGIALLPVTVDPVIVLSAGVMLSAGVLGLLVLMVGHRVHSSRLIPTALRPYAVPQLQKIEERFDQYRAKPATLAMTFALSLLVQLLRVSMVLILAWGLALDAPVTILLVLVPVVTFLEMIPISVGGLGVREAGYVYFLGLTGVFSERAFALSILLYSVVVISFLPGAALFLRSPKLGNAKGGA